MTAFVFQQSSHRVMLSHMALYGLASILQADGVQEVTMAWTGGGDPRPSVDGRDLDGTLVAATVLRHARSHAASSSWVQQDIVVDGKPRGLMSPRRTPAKDAAAWEQGQAARHRVLNDLSARRDWLDLRFLAALGEPSYWNSNAKGERLPDDGASRLEMQPRNQGSEFVGSRLRKLAGAVAARGHEAILRGLTGQNPQDEAGKNELDSRTATGFASPGPTDNALAWCALWGIATFPLAMRIAEHSPISRTAVTAGHAGRKSGECFFVPMWQEMWRPARLRSVIASNALSTAATAGTPLGRANEQDVAVARAWLRPRGVVGLVRFPIERFGSSSAPERRAMGGNLAPLGVGW